jgi:site-specific recombinase XerD
MTERILDSQHLNTFREQLIREEKSRATVEKYLRDAGAFLAYSLGCSITKEHTVSYKQSLQEKGYASRSINSMLASVNSLLEFFGRFFCYYEYYIGMIN